MTRIWIQNIFGRRRLIVRLPFGWNYLSRTFYLPTWVESRLSGKV